MFQSEENTVACQHFHRLLISMKMSTILTKSGLSTSNIKFLPTLPSLLPPPSLQLILPPFPLLSSSLSYSSSFWASAPEGADDLHLQHMHNLPYFMSIPPSHPATPLPPEDCAYAEYIGHQPLWELLPQPPSQYPSEVGHQSTDDH